MNDAAETSSIDVLRLDHVAFGVKSFDRAAAVLHSLGAVPKAGGPAGVFEGGQFQFDGNEDTGIPLCREADKWLHHSIQKAGATLEIIQPSSDDSFLQR